MPGLRDSGPYISKTDVGLLRQIHQVRHRGLHPVRHLVLRDARFDLRIAVGRLPHRVELRGRIEHLAPHCLAHTRRVVEEQHGRAAGTESHTLVARREEAARPKPREQRLVGVDGVRLRQEHDERRQRLVLAAETVTEPRAHARPARLLESGLDERDRRIVIDRVRVHRLDDGDVVDDLRRVGQELADPRAGLGRGVRTHTRSSPPAATTGPSSARRAGPCAPNRGSGCPGSPRGSACSRRSRAAKARRIDGGR